MLDTPITHNRNFVASVWLGHQLVAQFLISSIFYHLRIFDLICDVVFIQSATVAFVDHTWHTDHLASHSVY